MSSLHTALQQAILDAVENFTDSIELGSAEAMSFKVELYEPKQMEVNGEPATVVGHIETEYAEVSSVITDWIVHNEQGFHAVVDKQFATT